MSFGQTLSDEQIAQLIGGGECFIHIHPKEPLDFTDSLELMAAEPITNVTSPTYTPTKFEEMLLCDTTNNNITITLPLAFNGREFYVVKMAPQHTVYVLPTPPDTILGSTVGVEILNQFTSIHFKAIAGVTGIPNGYIAK